MKLPIQLHELDPNEIKERVYEWYQTENALFIVFLVNKDLLKRNLNIVIEPNFISAGLKDADPYVEGKLYGSIDITNSTWKLETVGKSIRDEVQYCVITLIKDISGSTWPLLISSGRSGPNPDPRSTFLLGQLTEPVLYAKALNFYKASGERGHIPAQIRLGELYDLGNEEAGVKQNSEEARKWYGLAADNGSLKALFYLASYEYKMRDSGGDLKKALIMYQKIVSVFEPRLPTTEELIGISPLGEPIFQNNNKAYANIAHLIKIYFASTYMVSRLLTEGTHNIQPDFHLAIIYLGKGMKYSHAPSYYQMGVMLKEGLGVDVNLVFASKAFRKANELDPNFKIPEGTLSEEEIEEIENKNKQKMNEDDTFSSKSIDRDFNTDKEKGKGWDKSQVGMLTFLAAAIVAGIAFITLKSRQK